jgi:hypothetical protein
MTTQQTAIAAKKLIDELGEIQKSQHKYAQVDQANWMTDKLEHLQQLMTYVVDDLAQDDGYSQLEFVAEHSTEIEGRYLKAI